MEKRCNLYNESTLLPVMVSTIFLAAFMLKIFHFVTSINVSQELLHEEEVLQETGGF